MCWFAACRAGENICCPEGFQAVRGWDPVSGLGSIGDYRLLRKLVLQAGRASAGTGTHNARL